MAERYKSIGMKESQYQAVADKKRAFEHTVGRRFDWGSFLLILAGLRSVDELAGEDREKVAEMHDSEGEALLGELEEFESFELPTTQQVEEIVNRAVDRLLRELKGERRGDRA